MNCSPARHLIALLGGVLLLAQSVPVAGQATPGATPAASPIAVAGCDALAPYFQSVATLVEDNEGLALIREYGFNPLALSDADAAHVVESLDALIVAVAAIQPPEPARAWHGAYVALLAWYRDLAATEDPLALQAIINNDRQLFGNLGMAQLEGQSVCGYAVWTDAWEAAFGE
jgi:hypothetical protein